MGILERKEKQKTQMKKEIIEAALTIATDIGWDELSTRKLAEHLEYSTTIIYTHFKNKEALLLEIREEGFRAYSEIITKSLAINPGDELAAIRQISLEIFHLARTRPVIHQLMFSYGVLSCKTNTSVEGTKAFSEMGGLFEKVYNKDGFTRQMGWWASHQGFVNLMISKQYRGTEDELFKLYKDNLNRILN